MNEILQKISVTENELCFCFQFGIRVGTDFTGGKISWYCGPKVFETLYLAAKQHLIFF